MNQDQDKKQAHYVHSLSYSARERLVGVFVLISILFLIALIGLNEKTLRFFEDKLEYHVYFSSAKGLSTDTLVKVSGLEVGKVAALDISEDHQIHATIHVYERYGGFIRADSQAQLNRLAVIGTATIEISAGSPEGPPLPNGSFMPAEETLSLDELIEGLAKLVNMGETKNNVNVLANLSAAVDNLKIVTGKIRSGEGALGTLIYGEEFHNNLSNAVATLDQVMADASESMSQAKPLVADTKAVVSDLRTAASDLPAMVNQANNAISKVDTALTTLNTELEQFPDVLVRLNLVLEETTRVLEAMQRVWPLSSAVQPKGQQQMIQVEPVNE